MSAAAVILAAGESSRLGRPKQDVVLNGETLLVRAIRVARQAALSPILVVVRDPRYVDMLDQHGVTVVLNRKAHEGMATSVRAGVEAAQALNVGGVVVMTCDQPGVTAEHLTALIAEPGMITGSSYSQRNGVPAYFPSSAFPELTQLSGDVGARELLREARALHLQVLSVDIDTEEDFRTAQILFER